MAPTGACTSTLSPADRFIKAWPVGEFTDIFPAAKSTSLGSTNVYVTSSSSSNKRKERDASSPSSSPSSSSSYHTSSSSSNKRIERDASSSSSSSSSLTNFQKARKRGREYRDNKRVEEVYTAWKQKTQLAGFEIPLDSDIYGWKGFSNITKEPSNKEQRNRVNGKLVYYCKEPKDGELKTYDGDTINMHAHVKTPYDAAFSAEQLIQNIKDLSANLKTIVDARSKHHSCPIYLIAGSLYQNPINHSGVLVWI